MSADADPEPTITAKTQIRFSPAQLAGFCGFLLAAAAWCYGVKNDIGAIKVAIADMQATGWRSGDSDRYRDRVQGAIDVWEEKFERDLSAAFGKPFTLPRLQLPPLAPTR